MRSLLKFLRIISLIKSKLVSALDFFLLSFCLPQVSSVVCVRMISVLIFFCCLQAVERVLFPHLPAYWANLQAVLDDYSVSNAQVKADGHKVYGAILVSSAIKL